MLDVFRQDAFSLVSMTAAINKRPYKPGRIGELKLFKESGISTTTVVIEEKQGTLELIQSSPRGGAASSYVEARRKARALLVPHFQKDSRINADQVQGVRQFGSEDMLETVQNVVNQRLDTLRAMHEVTLEFQRIGALKGLILDADGSTMFNLFTEFGVSQQTYEIDLVAGEVRRQIVEIARLVESELGATVYSNLRAFCGENFFDAFLEDDEVRETFKYQEGRVLREDLRRTGFVYGGVTWQEYRGSVSGQDFVDADQAFVFPEGADIFQTTFSPADYVETVNTIGLPIYAKTAPDPSWNKYVDVQAQSNPLSLCLRPRAVVKVTLNT